jgi:hypothetical protein
MKRMISSNGLRPAGTAALILLFILLFFPIRSNAQSNFDVQVERVIMTLNSPVDTTGLVTIGYDPGDEGTFLSLGAQDPFGTAFGIIVSNRYLPSRSLSDTRQSVSVPFDLEELSLSASTFPTVLTVFVHVFSQPADYPFDPSTFVDTKTVQVVDLFDNAQGSKTSTLTVQSIRTRTRTRGT